MSLLVPKYVRKPNGYNVCGTSDMCYNIIGVIRMEYWLVSTIKNKINICYGHQTHTKTQDSINMFHGKIIIHHYHNGICCKLLNCCRPEVQIYIINAKIVWNKFQVKRLIDLVCFKKIKILKFLKTLDNTYLFKIILCDSSYFKCLYVIFYQALKL